jgi:nucleotide-binding universal stress UspA family protein
MRLPVAYAIGSGSGLFSAQFRSSSCIVCDDGGRRVHQRHHPRWTCRRGPDGVQRSGSRKSERTGGRRGRAALAPGTGRGRGAKRTALYDDMAAYAAHFRPLLEQELAAEQEAARAAAADARGGESSSSNHGVRDTRIAKEGRLFGQMQYVLRHAARNERLGEYCSISKGDLVDISSRNSTRRASSRSSSTPNRREHTDEADEDEAQAEASVLERTPWAITVTVPLGSESARILDMFVENNAALDVMPGTNALANERAVAALGSVTDKAVDQSAVTNIIVRSLQDTSRESAPEKKLNRARGSASSVIEDDLDTWDDSENLGDDNKIAENMTHRVLAQFARGPSARVVQDVANHGHPSSGGGQQQNVNPWEDAARASPPSANLAAIAQTVKDISAMDLPLNPAQRLALRLSLSRSVTLIQGPPGTGKTQTAARVVVGAVLAGRGPVLATASSNVAVDNLMEAVLNIAPQSLRVVRVGRVAAVNERLWDQTLEGLLERDAKVRSARQRAEKDSSEFSAAKEAERLAAERILRGADVVLSTCVSAGRDVLEGIEFQFVLCDEATQATEPDLLIPLAAAGASTLCQLVLVGDHHQLPPTVMSDSAALSCPLFFRLWTLGVLSTMLNTQYRMHPQIASFPARYFYFGKLLSAVGKNDRPLPVSDAVQPRTKEGGLLVAPLLRQQRVLFIDVQDGHDWMDSGTPEYTSSHGPSGFSFINKQEAEVLVQVVSHLPFASGDIGVISPYAGQVRLLTRTFGRDPAGVEVSTVDGFQGREKEAIVVSCVRSNEEGRVGFLSDWRRLNVALTRARTALIVIGSSRTLRNDVHWRAWLNNAKVIDSLSLPGVAPSA